MSVNHCLIRLTMSIERETTIKAWFDPSLLVRQGMSLDVDPFFRTVPTTALGGSPRTLDLAGPRTGRVVSTTLLCDRLEGAMGVKKHQNK